MVNPIIKRSNPNEKQQEWGFMESISDSQISDDALPALVCRKRPAQNQLNDCTISTRSAIPQSFHGVSPQLQCTQSPLISSLIVPVADLQSIRRVLHRTRQDLDLALKKLEAIEALHASSKLDRVSIESIIGAPIPVPVSIQLNKGKAKEDLTMVDASQQANQSLTQSVIVKNIPCVINNPNLQHKPPVCSHLYVSGMLRMSLSAVKERLKRPDIRAQLRHIINLSWINDTVLEIIVLEKASLVLQQRFKIHPTIHLLEGFDPLDPEYFSWQSKVSGFRKKLALKKAFLKRLASSSIISSSAKTKNYLSAWVERRGWTSDFNTVLQQPNVSNSLLTTEVIHASVPGPSTSNSVVFSEQSSIGAVTSGKASILCGNFDSTMDIESVSSSSSSSNGSQHSCY